MIYGKLYHDWTLGDGYTLGDGKLLGEQTGRWHVFKRKCEDPIRRPVLSVFVERQGDVSDKVLNVSFSRKIKDSLHEPGHGSGSVVLLDPDGDLIQNGRSLIQPDDKVKIWAGWKDAKGWESDMLPRFTGVVREPVVDTAGSTVTLSLQDFGYTMKQAQTSGDWSDYDTPKALVNELISRLSLGTPEWVQEDAAPSTYSLNTSNLSRRNYWKITHGATLGINYIFYFDHNGTLQCKPRSWYNDTDVWLDDSDIIWIRHLRMAELINEKSFDLGTETVNWSGFMAGDHIRWGMDTYVDKDMQAQALYGEAADYEAEEMIADWSSIYRFVREAVEQNHHRRSLYEVRLKARPYLDISDRIHINSERYNIKGDMTIQGMAEDISGANYGQALTVLTEREFV